MGLDWWFSQPRGARTSRRAEDESAVAQPAHAAGRQHCPAAGTDRGHHLQSLLSTSAFPGLDGSSSLPLHLIDSWSGRVLALYIYSTCVLCNATGHSIMEEVGEQGGFGAHAGTSFRYRISFGFSLRARPLRVCLHLFLLTYIHIDRQVSLTLASTHLCRQGRNSDRGRQGACPGLSYQIRPRYGRSTPPPCSPNVILVDPFLTKPRTPFEATCHHFRSVTNLDGLIIAYPGRLPC